MKTPTPCCPPVLHARFQPRDASTLASAFKALADPARLALLSFIGAQPDGEACVCHLTGAVGLSQPTVSHHLKVLRAAGLVDFEKRGTWAYYRIVPERIEALQAALAVPHATRRRATACRTRRKA